MQAPSRLRFTQKRMFPIIEQYLESGLTQKAFSKNQSLPLHVFHYWLKKYRGEQKQTDESGSSKKPQGPAFLPIQLTGMPSSGCEISFPNGVKLRFPHMPEAEQLSHLIRSCGT